MSPMVPNSVAETDAIFARAYAEAITSKFSLKFGKGQILYLSPLVRGIPGGDLIYPEMTNYLNYRFGDALLAADTAEGVYVGGGVASYIQDLRTYTDYIYTKTDPSPEVAHEMEKARETAGIADKKYDEALSEAVGQWGTQRSAGGTKQKFWDWVQHSATYLLQTIEGQKQAQTNLDSVAQKYYGPQAARLADIRKGLRDAMETNPERVFQGYNQAGITADNDMIAAFEAIANGGKKPPESDFQSYIVRVPDYGIQGYKASMNAWMTKAADPKAKRDQILKINVKKGKQKTWQDFGFATPLRGAEAVKPKVFPLFSATVKNNGQTEGTFTLKTAGKETDISIEVAAIGIELFPVNAGLWDVPGIKKQFPKLVDGAPDVLDSQNARPISVLVAYDAALTVTFGDPEMQTEVKQWYDKAKNSTGGSMNVFGMKVGEGAGAGVDWDDISGSITVIPAPGQVYPSILAVFGQRL